MPLFEQQPFCILDTLCPLLISTEMNEDVVAHPRGPNRLVVRRWVSLAGARQRCNVLDDMVLGEGGLYVGLERSDGSSSAISLVDTRVYPHEHDGSTLAYALWI